MVCFVSKAKNKTEYIPCVMTVHTVYEYILVFPNKLQLITYIKPL